MCLGPNMDYLTPQIFERLKARNWKIATAESCTGGLIGWALTEISGASEFYDRGFITYSNDSKTELLGVPKTLIDQFGAVSHEVAEAMANGALAASKADIAVSATGIAGPDPSENGKPAGLIYIGVATRHTSYVFEHSFSGTRSLNRKNTVSSALIHVLQILSDNH